MQVGKQFRIMLVTIFVTACLCAMPETGFGSCGDYLHTKNSKPAELREIAEYPADASLTPSTSIRHQLPSERPCSGPSCHQGNSPNRVPFAPPSVEVRLQWEACFGIEIAQLAAGGPSPPVAFLTADEDPGHPQLLERPPQANR